MITKSEPTVQRPSAWQNALCHIIRDPAVLLERLQLPSNLLPKAEQAAQHFPLRVTESFLKRIKPGDVQDPLLRQILPLGDEITHLTEGLSDPVGDLNSMVSPGLLHKYHGRALLVMTAACAIHCRYCFRRHFPYGQANPAQSYWPATLAYLRQHPEIHEIILSGGDPLSLTDERLSQMQDKLASIKHIRTLRIHTRLPVVLPERVDDRLLNWLSQSPFQVVMVLHINHANEIDESVTTSLTKLRHTGATLLNQSVLLRGVNDDAETLIRLSHALFNCGILPYYLHQFDQVAGAQHFAVDKSHGLAIMAQLKAQLPGYLVPRYVEEIPGHAAKSSIQCETAN